MNNAEKIGKLVERFGKSVQVFEKKRVLGFISITHHRGWLWIEDAGGHWSVTLASDKAEHQPLNGPALCADFRKDNGERKIGPLDLIGAWKSTLSMLPIRNEEEAIRVFNLISSQIELALHFYSEAAEK